MSETSFSFTLGDFRVWVVGDGSYAYPNPASTFFLDAPRDQLRAKLQQRGIDLDRWSEFVSDYSCVLIDTGLRRILIDTGGGRLSRTTGNLLGNLESLGLPPDQIDTVVLTHAHPDHSGGAVDESGHPAFPSSRVKVLRPEWEYWTSEPDLSRLRVSAHLREVLGTIGRDYLEPIRDQVDLVDLDTEIVPGVQLIDASGHTPGHVAVDVFSQGAHLLYVSDAILHPLHIEEPSWNASVDLVPDEAVSSRRRLLRRAVSEHALVHGFHFAFPGLGHVDPMGASWKWKPLSAREANEPKAGPLSD